MPYGSVYPTGGAVRHLKDSVDERVYRALSLRCGLFETFVGPMQPVLSQALRMLIGRVPVDEAALARIAEDIKANPTVMQAFPEDDAVPPDEEPGLVAQSDTETLLAALDGSGVRVVAETNSLHRIGSGPLGLVTDLSAIASHPDAACIDGLDRRQRQLLQQLQQPGERLPLVVVSSEQGSFRASACAWVGPDGALPVRSMADLKALVAAWDGREVSNDAWLAARAQMQIQVKKQVVEMAARYSAAAAVKSAAQREAARLRLVDELGRLLICYEPDTDDLNGKFYRLATEQTPTGHRLQTVFGRLGALTLSGRVTTSPICATSGRSWDPARSRAD